MSGTAFGQLEFAWPIILSNERKRRDGSGPVNWEKRKRAGDELVHFARALQNRYLLEIDDVAKAMEFAAYCLREMWGNGDEPECDDCGSGEAS